MVDKICSFIVAKMRKKMPEIDDEKAEVITYGIQLIIGEIPKVLLIFVLSIPLDIWWYTVFAFLTMMPYKGASGGLHLKTHLGCMIGSCLYYYGNIILSKAIVLNDITKFILIFCAFIFGIIMVTLHAPADTENVPILSKKERKMKKILSYIFLTATLVASIFIKNPILSNILVFGTILQSIFISRLAYKVTNNKYGFELYKEQLNTSN